MMEELRSDTGEAGGIQSEKHMGK